MSVLKNLFSCIGLSLAFALASNANAFCGSNDPLKSGALPASPTSSDNSLPPGGRIALGCDMPGDRPFFSNLGMNSFTNKLELVEVYSKSAGNTICKKEGCDPVLRNMRDTVDRLAAIGNSDAAGKLASIVFAKLPKCAPTSTSSTIQSLDMDANANYVAARSAVGIAFAGQITALQAGLRVDVKYPTGMPVTFVIKQASPGNPPIIELALPQIADPADTPCK